MQWIVSLTPECGEDPIALLANPPEGAAIVEIRLDLFPGLEPSAAVAAAPLPLLLTLRSTAEGGRGPDDPGQRREILRKALMAAPAMIDLEFQRDRSLIREFGLSPERYMLSFHDPESVPGNIEDIAREMLECPAALIKIITSPSGIRDLEKTLALFNPEQKRTARDAGRLIAFGMGTVGLPTRFLSPLLGAPLGFTSWRHGASAAPGQKTLREMEAVCGHLSGPPRRIFGVVGSDVSTSLSPILHAAAYRELGIPDLFLPISLSDPSDLDEIFRPEGETAFDRLNLPVGGWAVTRPYKEIAARSADFPAPRVRRSGAANTLILKKDRIIAENTDADGVTASLKAAGIGIEGARVLIQGSGGASRGAAVGLDLAGAEVYLRGRDPEKCAGIAENLKIQSAPEGLDAEILINATPLGSGGDDPLPFSEDEIRGAEAVLDMVYGTEKTSLIRLAQSLEKTTVDGRTMLAYQGMAQFAAFETRIPPKRAMLEALGLSGI